MSTAAIEINPNLRLPDNRTMVDLDSDVYGEIAPYEEVVVFEGVSGLTGRGWVDEINEEHRSVTVLVDWALLTIPSSGHTLGLPQHDLSVNQSLPDPVSTAA
jgi:hypothetical protein